MCPGLGFEKFSVDRGKEFGLSQRVIDGHQEDARGRSRKLPQGPRGRRHDRARWRLRIRLDAARHLRAGADLFFVDYVGFSVLDTIHCATLGGAKGR